jgi:hypothetical protein
MVASPIKGSGTVSGGIQRLGSPPHPVLRTPQRAAARGRLRPSASLVAEVSRALAPPRLQIHTKARHEHCRGRPIGTASLRDTIRCASLPSVRWSSLTCARSASRRSPASSRSCRRRTPCRSGTYCGSAFDAAEHTPVAFHPRWDLLGANRVRTCRPHRRRIGYPRGDGFAPPPPPQAAGTIDPWQVAVRGGSTDV